MASHTADVRAPAPIRVVDGYAPIEDHGLIGDGSTAALVAGDGSLSWLCVPRFDAPPLFAAVLDAGRGGSLRIAPEGVTESRQWYEPGTGILHSELHSAGAAIRITDAMTLRAGADLVEDVAAGRGELVRHVRVLRGPAAVTVDVAPAPPWRATGVPGGMAFHGGPTGVRMWSSRPLEGPRTTLHLGEGDHLDVVLGWGRRLGRRVSSTTRERLDLTAAAWRRWLDGVSYAGPRQDLVRRSALTLKLLDHFANGAIVAAPTSSLPESIGGSRNWDYRYAWIRDAAFSVYAMRRIGLRHEARGFLAWVLDAVERHGTPRVLYDLDGEEAPPERLDPVLEGYRASHPVRWGNGATEQTQHDVYGEILDCAYQWASGGGEIDEVLWASLSPLIEAAATSWRAPDHGIWEVRTAARPFTYSAGMCQVALDRGTRLAERFGLPGDVQRWRSLSDRIRRDILEEAWAPETGSLTEHLGGGGLDASLLALPLRRVIRADHPRMVATTTAVRERLGAGNGLLYRYLPDESPDGLPGHEGAFLLCSFWLADNLALQGRVEEATELFESLCDRANPLGLLPEQIDPSTGAFLGNYPQAFSHVGLISSAVTLSRTRERR